MELPCKELQALGRTLLGKLSVQGELPGKIKGKKYKEAVHELAESKWCK